jgi:hypothetical protein
MKKIMVVSIAIVFALTLGVAYADDMSKDTSKADNGITIFSKSAVGTEDINFRPVEYASEARLAHPELALDNGVTLFASTPVDTEVLYKGGEVIKGEEGMAAGGYEEEAPALDLHNGITSFDRGPIEAN